MQERQTGGYLTAEAMGRLIRKQVILTPAAITVGTVGPVANEQTFDVLGVKATDFALKGNPETVIPGVAPLGIAGVRVAAISQIAINYINVGSAVITPTTGLLYTFLIYRR